MQELQSIDVLYSRYQMQCFVLDSIIRTYVHSTYASLAISISHDNEFLMYSEIAFSSNEMPLRFNEKTM